MSTAFKTLKAGDVLYDCAKERMGNTTIRILIVREIKILEMYANPEGSNLVER